MKNPCEKCNVSLIYKPNVPPGYRKSSYSNNSMVFYKPTSLPSCPVGTVKNSRIVSRRT